MVKGLRLGLFGLGLLFFPLAGPQAVVLQQGLDGFPPPGARELGSRAPTPMTATALPAGWQVPARAGGLALPRAASGSPQAVPPSNPRPGPAPRRSHELPANPDERLTQAPLQDGEPGVAEAPGGATAEGEGAPGGGEGAGGTPGAEEGGFPGGLGDDLEKEFGQTMESKISDPFSGYNRAITVFNDKLYFWFLRPVAIGYRTVVPEFARRGVLNFFRNLLFPVRFVNNLLQVKIVNAGEELLRFTLNTTIGVLGLWDPADVWFGLEAHDEDFGQTLGFYGVGAGPHIVLPFLGPSNLRDAVGLVPDWQLDPVSYVPRWDNELGIRFYDEINETSLEIGQYENLKKDALDLYPFLRDVYEQNRTKVISE